MKRAGFISLIASLPILFTACANLGRAPKPASVSNSAVIGKKEMTERLTGKIWLLTGIFMEGEYVIIPPEHGGFTAVYFETAETMNGRVNDKNISGTWSLQESSAAGEWPFRAALPAKPTAPPKNQAERFAAAFTESLRQARYLKTGKDSFRLLDGGKKVLLEFVYQNDSL